MAFRPIAVVGSACLLPGARRPEELWDAVAAGRDLLSAAPEGRWRADRERILSTVEGSAADHAWTDRGGYVEGFDESFDAHGFAIPADEIDELDVVFKWVLHCAREALRDAQQTRGSQTQGQRVGAVFGNLSFPSASMSRFAESVWFGNENRPDPRNRFSSGLPALILERALDLEAGAVALDAACASSLYAFKTACDWLHEGRADLVLAGAVNAADDLFIHVGFSALSALSPSGASRPFHREADGLVPAEGAGFLALKRLEDAERDGDRIHGVIRGIGLSNDGRGKGFLVPSEEGQVRALRAAYESAQLDPASVSLLECHATGTRLGDATEVRALAQVFANRSEPLPLGSLKSNVGHLITAAGVGAAIKVLQAMKAGVRPPTLHADNEIEDLADGPFRLLHEAEPWTVAEDTPDNPDHLRRAGISAFGFGGNNSHMILEEYRGPAVAIGAGSEVRCKSDIAADDDAIAVVGIGLTVGDCANQRAFLARWFGVTNPADDVLAAETRMSELEIEMAGLGIPPNDLRQTLAQQLAVLTAATQAAAEVAPLVSERAAAYVGMGVDAEIARYGARWRLGDHADDSEAAVRDAIVPALESAGVIGTMPNIVTNRINRALDLGGPSCSVSAEECSGLEALELATGALRRGEIDAAVVAAVDISCEPVHEAALAACAQGVPPRSADGAVAIVVKRFTDALRDGDRVYAVLESGGLSDGHSGRSVARGGDGSMEPAHENGLHLLGDHDSVLFRETPLQLSERWGHAHAASGLMQVAVASLALSNRLLVGGTPWLASVGRRALVSVRRMEGRADARSRWHLSQAPDEAENHSNEGTLAASTPEVTAPVFHVYEGSDREAVLDALLEDRRSVPWDSATNGAVNTPPARLVIVAADPATLESRRARARALLQTGAPGGEGVHYRDKPVRGELGFVFASAGTSYDGMGRELLRALPTLGDRLGRRFSALPAALGWAYEGPERQPDDDERLWGASAVSQLHTELSRGLFGLQPTAAIGYSSGESNSLFALGAWSDMDAMRSEIAESRVYESELGGEFRAVARAWGEQGPVVWQAWNVSASAEEVRSILATIDRVHLAIIHTDRDCVVAGEAEGCRRLVDKVGASRCRRLDYKFAAHVPEVDEFRQQWLDIHRREVTPPPGIRFYSGGSDGAYTPGREACAQHILAQSLSTLDFPRMIESAWKDGVRVFLEHGPGGACSSWIREILGERVADAVVVSLDRRDRGLDQALDAAAALIAAGVELDPRPFVHELSASPDFPQVASPTVASKTLLRLPAHPPAFPAIAVDNTERAKSKEPTVTAPPTENAPADIEARETMQPAPYLPPASDGVGYSPAPVSAASPPVVEAPVAAVVTDPPFSEPVPAVSDTNGAGLHVVAELSSPVAAMVQVHQQFVQQQADVHERFLRMQESLQQKALVAAVGSAPPAEEMVTGFTQDAVALDPTPSGLRLNRAQLQVHSAGKISDIYGPLFARQDAYRRQVRMPDGLLLLADRVSGIDAEAGVLAKGTLWSETDVRRDSWYLNDGRMPAGVLIESGQADLMLISYMGADFLNRGDRIYRLLGCRLTFEADLPSPGDTLCYDIHVDGHAVQDDIRLFFFHYDCVVDGKPQIRVREGQAGFFTDAELADSAGVLWSAEDAEPCADPRLDAPTIVCERESFTNEQVRAFANGRAWDCFGPAYDMCRTHTRSPRIQNDRMLFLETVPAFNTRGGPWGRGYLRAETEIHSDDWYFDGHFRGDPCMPGTLMFEGCLQALSFYTAALGFTAERDGWRFQPVKGEEIDLRCRGQVTPTSERITYEVFVEEVIAGPVPTVYADLLCTVDGLKAFHAKRVGLQLVPDWPLESATELLDGYVEPKPVARVAIPQGGDFEFGYASLLACAWGRPSQAFGPLYERFDGPGRVPRLPGPPYHFLSRVLAVTGDIGGMQVGSTVEVEYDVPADAWYFDDNGTRTMPFAVLLEAALQPCGWLASYIGSALTTQDELAFRNLDGTGTLTAELVEDAGVLRTCVELTGVSRSAGMIIVDFAVECFLGEGKVYELATVFGFFPPAALVTQVGLATDDDARALLGKSSDFFVDLADEPAPYFGAAASLGNGKLRMLDRVSGFWPEGGAQGLGLVRAERDIDVDDWYFKAHFFQDPVQPGSLGIEAMIQLLQFYMLETGMDEGIEHSRFEPLALGHAMTWKYRGQVIPSNELVQITVEVTERGRDENGPYALAEASLWCDGIRIYSAANLGMRIVSAVPAVRLNNLGPSRDASITLDPAVDRWLDDHRPTWQRPALPMMSIVDMLAAALAGRTVVEIRDVALKGWVDFEGPRHLETRIEERGADLFDVSLWTRLQGAPANALQDAGAVELARAVLRTGSYREPPPPLPACSGAAMDDPYETGRLFHGAAFQLLKSGVLGSDGASARLDAAAGAVPTGALHPALLDAALHAIPHDRLHLWTDEIGEDRVAYPARVLDLQLYGPTPRSGEIRVEVRFDGFLASPDLPRFKLQLISNDCVWAEMTLVEACFAKGPLGSAQPGQRRAFLRDRTYVEGLSLSRHSGGETRLSQAEIDATDWMPGTVEAVYATRTLEEIAIKEHLAARERLHPRILPAALPLSRLAIVVEHAGDEIVVRDAIAEPGARTRMDLTKLSEFWGPQSGVSGPWIGKDLMEGLIERYVARVVVEDPEGFAALADRGAIFVGNHQVQIESVLVTHILAGLMRMPVVTMANAKHESGWVGWLLDRLRSYPGSRAPSSVVYADPQDPQSMFGTIERLGEQLSDGGRSFFVHCQGTRARSCREQTDTISSLFLDLAIEQNLPIVPVRFRGGLPVEPIEGKLEFPVGHARQDYWIGAPIASAELSELAYRDRRVRVLDALNALGESARDEQPHPGDVAFSDAVKSWSDRTGAREVEATFLRILEQASVPSDVTRQLIEGAKQGHMVVPPGPQGEWLRELAAPLFGPRGPEIRSLS